MEYTVHRLGKIAGISTRTLRYYDEIGLLCPARVSTNGYRIYGQAEVDRLQQILFYKELGVGLEDIKAILSDPHYDTIAALQQHLSALMAKKQQLSALIDNVEKTLSAKRGEITMSDKEKFEGFVDRLIDNNERQYGDEIRARYGDDVVDRSNAKIRKMTKEQYDEIERLSLAVNKALKAAYEAGDPAGELAHKACELHKQWLCFYWPQYSKEAHKGLGEMYVADARFKVYYDRIAEGCAQFLCDAIQIYCNR